MNESTASGRAAEITAASLHSPVDSAVTEAAVTEAAAAGTAPTTHSAPTTSADLGITPVERPHHGCGCMRHSQEELVLDARSIPGPIRHAAILGALDSLQAGDALTIVAGHVPRPLLNQVEQKWPGRFDYHLVSQQADRAAVRLTHITGS